MSRLVFEEKNLEAGSSLLFLYIQPELNPYSKLRHIRMIKICKPFYEINPEYPEDI
jgi:hypothetical protein